MVYFSDEQINEKLLLLHENWDVEGEGKEEALAREFSFNTFIEAIDFVNKIKELVEKEEYYPNIMIHSQKYVEILLSTKDVGITEKEFEFALEIDSL